MPSARSNEPSDLPKARAMTAIRVRRATDDDLDLLVWVMVEAATSHLDRCVWDVVLGDQAPAASVVLREAARSENHHWCHLDRFLVAEVGDEVVGAASSYDPAAEGNDALAYAILDTLVSVGADDATVEGIVARSTVLEGCTPKPYVGAWGVENVAVRPAHRSTGVVQALLAAVRDDALRERREHLQIMCLDGNARARRAWERSGFDLRASYRGRDFQDLFGCGGLDLLVEEL